MSAAEQIITLQDLDVILCFGEKQALTLYPADDLTFHENGDIEITFREKSSERVVLRAAYIQSYSLRDRVVKVVPKKDAQS